MNNTNIKTILDYIITKFNVNTIQSPCDDHKKYNTILTFNSIHQAAMNLPFEDLPVEHWWRIHYISVAVITIDELLYKYEYDNLMYHILDVIKNIQIVLKLYN
jgi:hypothetical protein